MVRLMHLVFEGSVKGILELSHIHEYLLSSIIASGMTLVEGPRVYQEGEEIQGYCILAESHTSVHYIKREWNYAWCDLFSCQPFKSNLVLEKAEAMLHMDIKNYCILQRGLEFLED